MTASAMARVQPVYEIVGPPVEMPIEPFCNGGGQPACCDCRCEDTLLAAACALSHNACSGSLVRRGRDTHGTRVCVCVCVCVEPSQTGVGNRHAVTAAASSLCTTSQCMHHRARERLLTKRENAMLRSCEREVAAHVRQSWVLSRGACGIVRKITNGARDWHAAIAASEAGSKSHVWRPAHFLAGRAVAVCSIARGGRDKCWTRGGVCDGGGDWRVGGAGGPRTAAPWACRWRRGRSAMPGGWPPSRSS